MWVIGGESVSIELNFKQWQHLKKNKLYERNRRFQIVFHSSILSFCVCLFAAELRSRKVLVLSNKASIFGTSFHFLSLISFLSTFSTISNHQSNLQLIFEQFLGNSHTKSNFTLYIVKVPRFVESASDESLKVKKRMQKMNMIKLLCVCSSVNSFETDQSSVRLSQ